MTKPILLPAALALALGTAAMSATPALAQMPAAPPGAGATAVPTQPNAARHAQQPRRNPDFGARAEARIAFIKAKLKITSAQEAAFGKYAQAIRSNAASMQKNFEAMRGQRGQNVTAIDRVEQRAKFAQLRDQQEQQYLAAFRPLYASLSADQKKVADDLAMPHRPFGRGAGPRRG